MSSNPAEDSPDEVAATMRRRLGISEDSALDDVLQSIEADAQVRVYMVPLPPDGIEGAYLVDRGIPFLFINQDFHPVKKRFTLAHEFGHYALGHGPQVDQRVDMRDTRRIEQSANAFAAAFLMPAAAVDLFFRARGNPKIDFEWVIRAAYHFGISVPATRYRLENLGRLTSPTLIRALDTSIKNGVHTPLARGMGLTHKRDLLAEAHEVGAHTPIDSQLKIADLVERSLIDVAGAARLMQVPETVATQRLANLDPGDEPTE